MIQNAADIDHNISPEKVKYILGRRPDPSAFLDEAGLLNIKKLKELYFSSVLSADQFNRELFIELCKLAAMMQLEAFPIRDTLYDRILATAFFEPSTRTRLSFESAMLKLGGKTLSVTEAATTGIAKGESIVDIGQMFNSYANAVVVRHTEQKALQELSEYLRIPLINAGNGSDEHPTQALADWYALLKWKPSLVKKNIPESEQINLGIVGTPGSMRTVKSFLLMALLFEPNIKKTIIVSEMADPLGSEVEDSLRKIKPNIEITNDLQEVIEELDVIYMNSIAFLGDGYRNLNDRYALSKGSKLKSDAVILHPLARKEELDISLDSTQHNLYFNQADGAVFIRQALLLAIFGRLDEVPPEFKQTKKKK